MEGRGGADKVEPSQLSLAEAERIIERLEEVVREQHVVLIGGQAVSIWTVQLQDLLQGHVTPGQIISSDIDFLGNAADVQLAADLLGGRARLAKWEDRTTLAGVAIFLDSDGHERRLDFLKNPYGMDSDDVRNTAIEIDLDLPADKHVPVWVMHPERCMESRVHNSALYPASRPTSPGDSCGHRSCAPEPSPNCYSRSAERPASGMP